MTTPKTNDPSPEAPKLDAAGRLAVVTLIEGLLRYAKRIKPAVEEWDGEVVSGGGK